MRHVSKDALTKYQGGPSIASVYHPSCNSYSSFAAFATQLSCFSLETAMNDPSPGALHPSYGIFDPSVNSVNGPVTADMSEASRSIRNPRAVGETNDVHGFLQACFNGVKDFATNTLNHVVSNMISYSKGDIYNVLVM
jgi:hypothetical protein